MSGVQYPDFYSRDYSDDWIYNDLRQRNFPRARPTELNVPSTNLNVEPTFSVTPEDEEGISKNFLSYLFQINF